jgi:ferritin-like metal-binding protein YciE
MARDPHEQLTKYLTDAHSIEVQALAQLEKAPDIAEDPGLVAAFREHRIETEAHERRTRALLEARGESQSTVKDLVMKLGGKGFLLFARVQPDTPGKLLAHALSYEALETASYELLARVADAAGEGEVAQAARGICSEERRMIERLEGCYDGAVTASLRAVEPWELRRQLGKYLADAHALEHQATTLLEKAPALSRDAEHAQLYRDHLTETRRHRQLVDERLTMLGGDTSALKDAAMKLGALNWAGFFAAHPDTPGKLAAFVYAFEHLEIGAYEQLKRVAERAGDLPTATLAEKILMDEREAASRLADKWDEAVRASLDALDVATPVSRAGAA